MQFTFSDRMANMNGTATREIFKLLSRPEIISFAGGLPATEALPTQAVQEIAQDVLGRDDAFRLLQYGTTEGYAPLQDEAVKLAQAFGVQLRDTSSVLILSGGQQGIDLMCKSFLNKGDVVLVEDPTYLAALQIFHSYEAVAIGVRACNEGLDTDDLEQKIQTYKPKFLYTVPTFSNPTGKTYTAENRVQIARITAKYGLPVLEDDPYARLRFSGEKVNALYSFAQEDNVVYQMSFSKILSPGLRVGAAIGNADVIRKMAVGKQGTDLHTSLPAQAVTAEYCRRGLLEPSVQKSLPLYHARKQAMMRGIERYMPAEFTHTDPDGGLFVWGAFEGTRLDTQALLHKAVARNVAYIQGNVFYADGGGANTVRLNYSNASEQKIDEGMRALGTFFKEEIAKERK
ncbi:MAG: PLP-dependent aminotransferase family protein [Clostridia bacterium]|jgi:2-aminoadipate transaminase|nr:PLP-dependent aminotransferase family protein [Clostridia bacterium]